jgi:hypothetical protein
MKATLTYDDESELRDALNGFTWKMVAIDLDNWLRSKTKHESGLETKSGTELEHYVDAYCSMREELRELVYDSGLNLDE